MLLTSRISPEMTYVDAAFSRSLMALVVFEYFADQQQWDYHQAKQSYQATAKVRRPTDEPRDANSILLLRSHQSGQELKWIADS